MISTSTLSEEKLVGLVRVFVLLVFAMLLIIMVAIEVVQSLLEVNPSRRVSVSQLEEMRWLRGVLRMIEL